MTKQKYNIILLLSLLSLLLLLLLIYYGLKYTSIYKDTFDNKTKFIAITYETDTNNENTQNIIAQFKKNNFNYIVLGNNDNWEGWYGRLMSYKKYIDDLSDDIYILLCDGRDVLINNVSSEYFLEKATTIYNEKKRIIVGTEEGCCTGDKITPNCIADKLSNNKPDNIQTLHEIYMDNMRNAHYKFINDTNNKNKIHNNFHYINFGLLFGKAIDFKKLFKLINIEKDEDDQLLLVKLFYDNPELLYLDYNQDIFSTASHKMSAQGKDKTDEQNCFYSYDENNKKFKNIITNTYPLIIHTPGKNWSCYNKLLSKL